ncbi:peptidoglycan-binding protein [Martelella sp. HB161492]|uniref:peptidoglycan-binding domain-containing protein n=1 Tax=Martelella sp. HB161492 TaxID=2720726 RepID=UPI001591E2D1|nr:peptidoglycan-binding protein [Martelella sp. HB161492]
MGKTTKKRGKSKKGSKPGLIARILLAGGAAIGRHPSVFGGVTIFAVVFSFVSANALWYQVGPHPDPMFKTRVDGEPDAIPGRTLVHEAGPYHSFRIERDGDNTVQAAAEERPAEQSGDAEIDELLAVMQRGAPAADAETSADTVADTAVAISPVQSDPADLLRQVQQELAARGYYKGTVDGVSGPQTAEAVAAFQKDNGLMVTGAADAGLLAAITASAATPLPSHRPETDSQNVAAVIRASASPGAADGAATLTLATVPVSTKTVTEIQRGLQNIAYDGIVVDGVAGQSTKAAILNFQKHYRLPETGEPSEAVLKKLQEIGAL